MNSRDIVVILTISAHAKHDYKLLTVSGPRRSTMQQFIRSLEGGLAGMSHYWVSQFSDSVRRDFRTSFDGASPFVSVSESGNQSYKTEEAAYYFFYKMLSNSAYSVGVELNGALSEFNSNFFPLTLSLEDSPRSSSLLPEMSPSKSGAPPPSLFGGSSEASLSLTNNLSVEIHTAATPEWPPIESMKKLTDLVAKTVRQCDLSYAPLHNPAAALADLLPRLPASVERYVFEAAGRSVWTHYRKFFHEADRAYFLKAIAIRGAHAGSLAESCGVRASFRFSFAKSAQLMDELERSFDLGVIAPNLLLQKLLSILVSIKTEVLTASKGQRELESMDDIAPVFLFTTLSASGLKAPNALYHFLLDFMPAEQGMETEGRAVALLEGATKLVMNDWHTTALMD